MPLQRTLHARLFNLPYDDSGSDGLVDLTPITVLRSPQWLHLTQTTCREFSCVSALYRLSLFDDHHLLRH